MDGLNVSYVRHKKKIIFHAINFFLLVCGGALLILHAQKLATCGFIPKHLSSHFHHIFEEIGKALAVAGVLASTVDIFLKKMLTAEVIRDVAPFIEGVGLPEQFRHEIAHIRRIPVYRKNFCLSYKITEDDFPQGFIKLSCSWLFEIVNSTDEDQIFDFSVAVEDKYPYIKSPKIISAGAKDGTKIIWQHKTCRWIQFSFPFLKKTEKTKWIETGHKIPIPPKSESITCWIHTESIVKADSEETFYMSHPTLNFTVHVDAPNDYHVNVDFGHRSKDIHQLPPENDTHTWRTGIALLTCHSLRTEWRPKPNENAV